MWPLLVGLPGPALHSLPEHCGSPPEIQRHGRVGANGSSLVPRRVYEAAPTCRVHHTAGVQNGMRWLEGTFPDKARGWVGFNVPMSHKITAACDLQLMPSRFEPCGLNQLYAMRYGAVPIAHETGGLKDTVLPFKPFDGGLSCTPEP